MVTLIHYPKCSTCKKAKAWLEDHGISYVERNIVEDRPKAEELREWITKFDYPVKRYFNTSGNLYKELHLKEKLETMNLEEQIQLLSTNGMLVKRPLVISEHGILIGFQESFWEEFFRKNS